MLTVVLASGCQGTLLYFLLYAEALGGSRDTLHRKSEMPCGWLARMTTQDSVIVTPNTGSGKLRASSSYPEPGSGEQARLCTGLPNSQAGQGMSSRA